ncbi:hypothetical protein RvY_08154 [Ramazzottius varieornatus]|uniref:Uncharacterized protein n=1 Tax=Ramazzottius varieornatus TaxID=947166 RepID=A0A1D1V4Y1_RAMVA|nr:hypothetical protein RvY_08154 [Ramazzottius varieornatus]
MNELSFVSNNGHAEHRTGTNHPFPVVEEGLSRKRRGPKDMHENVSALCNTTTLSPVSVLLTVDFPTTAATVPHHSASTQVPKESLPSLAG